MKTYFLPKQSVTGKSTLWSHVPAWAGAHDSACEDEEGGYFTFSSWVSEHRVSHHYYRPAQHMGQHEHMELF